MNLVPFLEIKKRPNVAFHKNPQNVYLVPAEDFKPKIDSGYYIRNNPVVNELNKRNIN